MKYFAIVDLPDDAPEWGDGKWIIDDEGSIRYLEDDNCWMHYKDFGPEGIELKPLPDYVEPIHEDDCWEKPTNSWLNGERTGWNECLDEILGENE